jgi:DNA-binding CsgD family transcriptional regulator
VRIFVAIRHRIRQNTALESEAMSQLVQNDYDLFLDCIRELYSIDELPALRLWLLEEALPKLLSSDWFSYNEVDLLHPANTLAILKPEAGTLFQRLFPRFQEVVHQHPLVTRQLQSPEFAVYKISDFLTQEDYHRLELYQDVYRHLGVEYQIAVTIRTEPARVTAFALSRRQNDYTERDRAILEMLRPHLVVAFNNLALARENMAIQDTTSLALNALASATIIVNSQGRILYHTGPGLKWIEAANPEVLPTNIYSWLNPPAGRRARRIMHLATATGEIQIRAVPTNSPERLLLVLTCENARSLLPASTDDFSLSQRQLEVAGWICQGKTNAEIAFILGLSPRTVQKHIEHIFEKTGVGSRMALAMLLGENTALKTARL